MNDLWDSQHPEYVSPIRANLAQAFRCFAFGLRPLAAKIEDRYEYPDFPYDIYDPELNLEMPIDEVEALQSAGDRLLELLASGNLEAKGCELTVAEFPSYRSGSDPLINLTRLCDWSEEKSIGHHFWKSFSVNFASRSLTSDILRESHNFENYKIANSLYRTKEIVGFARINIATEDLKMAFEESVAARKFISVENTAEQDLPDPQFRSPYLIFLLRAEAHFAERLQVEKKAVVDEWLLTEGRKEIGQDFSKHLAKAMGTILRTPKQAKGGNKKWPPKEAS